MHYLSTRILEHRGEMACGNTRRCHYFLDTAVAQGMEE